MAFRHLFELTKSRMWNVCNDNSLLEASRGEEGSFQGPEKVKDEKHVPPLKRDGVCNANQCG